MLIERLGIGLEEAGYVTSIYFLCRTAGCLTGSFLLNRISDRKVFLFSVIVMLIALTGLLFADSVTWIHIFIGMIENTFPDIYVGDFVKSISGLIDNMGLLLKMPELYRLSSITFWGVLLYLTGAILTSINRWRDFEIVHKFINRTFFVTYALGYFIIAKRFGLAIGIPLLEMAIIIAAITIIFGSIKKGNLEKSVGDGPLQTLESVLDYKIYLGIDFFYA